MPAFDELNQLVDAVNTEVAEFDMAKESLVQAQQIVNAADVAVTQEAVQVEEKLDALIAACQARIAEIQGDAPPPP